MPSPYKETSSKSRVLLRIILFTVIFTLSLASKNYPAQELFPFQGEVNTNNINIRVDSTSASEVICTLNKNSKVEVLIELYNWYKIRLPKNAPCYIKKNMTDCINYKINDRPNPLPEATTKKECQNAKIIKDRVNIRLKPNESSPILGIANKNETVNIITEKGEWYKIEPVQNSFGWAHKKFINKPQVIDSQKDTK